jgi:histidinol-phosphate aminotransferase
MKFTPLIDSLPSAVPFVGPEALARRTNAAIKARIGANENVFGPSPKVLEVMRKVAAESWAYGDPENHDLKLALAQHLNVGVENIAIGEGIDGLFGYAVRLFVSPGDTVVSSLGAYPTFNFHIAGFGGRLLTTPYLDDHENWPALLDLAEAENAKVIYLANPDNPMGTWHKASAIETLIAGTPENTMLMLDEAYGEFAPEGTLPPLDVSRKNLLRFRTFSKAYGMAGMRVGYCIGHPEIIAAFDKIRNHFGMNRISQAASVAALADTAWLSYIKHEVAKSRDRIYRIAKANGLTPIPSAANFVAIDCGRDGAYAKSIVDSLLEHGIFIRMPGVAPLNRCIRVSCGKETDLDLLAEVLPKVLATISNTNGLKN